LVWISIVFVKYRPVSRGRVLMIKTEGHLR